MANNQVPPRNLSLGSTPALSDEAQKAVNAAFDALSTWRVELATSSEKNSEQVIEKLAVAARALGWPEQIVDATRAQVQTLTKVQLQTLDHLMDAWEEQIKSPKAMTASPTAMLARMRSLPTFGVAGQWPNADALQMATMNPFQFWMEWPQHWQKACTEAMAFWTKAGGLPEGGGPRRP